MKFARYLEETQVPEWKKAYIDYRGLKKRITAIRLAQQEEGSTPLLPVSPVVDSRDVQTHSIHNAADQAPTLSISRLAATPAAVNSDTQSEYLSGGARQDGDDAAPSKVSLNLTPRAEETRVPESIRFSRESQDHADEDTEGGTSIASGHRHRQAHFEESESPAHSRSDDHAANSSYPNVLRSATLNMGFLPRLRRRSTMRSFWDTSHKGIHWDIAKSVPLKDLIPLLRPVQREFFHKLDAELDKVETFYVEREKELRLKTDTLKIQLQELKDHGRLYFETHNTTHSWMPAMMRRKPASSQSDVVETTPRTRRGYKASSGSPSRRESGRRRVLTSNNKALEQEIEYADSETIRRAESAATTVVAEGSGSSGGSGGEERRWKRLKPGFHKRSPPRHNVSAAAARLTPGLIHRRDPDDYLHARKWLKKAVLECYRGLEVLENYRTLNVIGFRKALKKFEKYTKIPAQQAYFLEKIEPSAFSSGAAVAGMLKELEGLYTARFAHGDPKAAKLRLRGQAQRKTHHYSTFRTGLLLGLAIPAFVDGIYLSFRSDTRQAIPAYNGLLFVYGILFIPVFFSLMVGLNILVWSKTRINYGFIFEFDVKTQLDHREYFEIPALLLSTLCYAFWLSFQGVGPPHFDPILWPLIWLLFAAVIMFDPLPLLFKPSRWWLLRNISRLLTSGMHRVEFADFWMGDQFCSLVFSLSNIFFLFCSYSRSFHSNWERCSANSGKTWGVPFILAVLPFIVRLVQSVKRWVDSGLVTHLINGGKYGAGIVYYLCYYIWRHQGGRGSSFAAYCIFATIYAIYASAWDLLMDWSVLRPHAKYPFLRDEILYTDHVPLYYFAMVTNILIRFIWVFYIPQQGPNMMLRTWIAGMLEVLRRVQWNFIRLENEHVGNMDQYRVTREVPLPYSVDDMGHESDGDEDDERKSISSWKKRKGKRVSPMTAEEEDREAIDELNASISRN